MESAAVANTVQPLSLFEAPSQSAVPTTQELGTWAADLATSHFGRPFSGHVVWAPRLRYRAGDFAPTTATIRLSLPYFKRYGPAEARGILLHELCHWWLSVQGIRHREDSPLFQDLLRKHGAPARGRPMPRRRARSTYEYCCPACGALYLYRRRVNYACGRCCRRASGGKYDARFRLKPVRHL